LKIELTHTYPVSREDLWALLHDVDRMASWIPGCERLEEVGPDRYEARLSVGVGAIKGAYSGLVRIDQKEFPSRYVLAVDGRAAPGFVRGSAVMQLSAQDPDHTILTVSAEAHVGGLLASVGQRYLNGIATQLTKQLLQNIEKEARRLVSSRQERVR
jgi:uncharacterized protein